MKKNFLLLLIALFPLSAMNEDSLKKCCLDFLLKDPREQIEAVLAHRLPLDLHDDIRERWYSKLDKSEYWGWWRHLVCSNNSTNIVSEDVWEISFNEQLDGFKIKIRVYPEERRLSGGMPNYIEKEFDLQGNELLGEKDTEFSNVGPRGPRLETADIIPYGLSQALCHEFYSPSPSSISPVHHSKKNKKIIGISNSKVPGGRGFVHDYALGEEFEKYIAERAPLAQILLLETLHKAYFRVGRINLTIDEKKILDGMPPQFEKAKGFLRRTFKLSVEN